MSQPFAMARPEIESAILRLERRRAELSAFDPFSMTIYNPPALLGLEAAISHTLERIFGAGTPSFNRFVDAADLHQRPFMDDPSLSEAKQTTQVKIAKSQSLLENAIRLLEEELSDYPPSNMLFEEVNSSKVVVKRTVFLVHGRDTSIREEVARFLERIEIEPIILHEKASRGLTIIEKIESHSDVRFAVVLATPDDEGCLKGETVQSRVRQNVLLELGYFIGKLGRRNVSVLKTGDIDLPTDFAGIVWQPFDSNGGWKISLCRELEAAGFTIDLNRALR